MYRRPLVDCCLMLTVVNKGMARKVVKASKEAGAEGGTTMIGRGTVPRGAKPFFGIPIEPEKEVILTVIGREQLEDVIKAVIEAGKLDKPGQGITFVIGVKQVGGICHVCVLSEKTERRAAMECNLLYDLIVTIVNKGYSETVVEASKKAGAEGGTIMFGRGTGIHEQAKLFGITIEPEKELVLTLVGREKTDSVLELVIREAELDKPGIGIAFVLEVERVAGISRLLREKQD
jgi:nitrogen regulatory protein PII